MNVHQGSAAAGLERRTDQAQPFRAGRLMAGMTCADLCPPEAAPGMPDNGCGVTAPGVDLGQRGTVTILGAQLGVADGTVSGMSPLTLNYKVDLSTLPPDVVVICVYAIYEITAPVGVQIADPGGQVSGAGPYRIDWSADAVASVRAAGRTPEFAVEAVCSWTFPPPTATFSIGSGNFVVDYITPVYE